MLILTRNIGISELKWLIVLGMVVFPLIPVLGRMTQGDHCEFKESLSYVLRTRLLKNQNQNKTQKEWLGVKLLGNYPTLGSKRNE